MHGFRLSNRPARRTKERRDTILRTPRSGGTRRAAAEYADINATMRNMVKHAEAEAEVRFATVLADSAFGRPTRYDEVGRVIRVEVPANPRDAKWWLSHRRPQDRGDRVIIDLEDAAAVGPLDIRTGVRYLR